MRRPLMLLLSALLVLPLTPAASSAQDGSSRVTRHPDGHLTTTGITQPTYSTWTVTEHRVETDHGTLYGVIQRPVVPDGVVVPVILTYSPYNSLSDPVRGRESQTGNLDSLAGYYVPRGYARAIFDLVGTGESGGCTDFGGIGERESGAQLVDWLGTREWSNGRVGMIGASYDGTTQYAAAIENPEHLTTIVPQVAIDRWWDYSYDGGIRRFSGYGTPLAFDYAFGMTPPTSTSDPGHSAEVLQARVNPCRRALHQVRGYGHDPVYDAFWDERDYREQVAEVTASVLVEGGWLDTNVQPVGSVRFFQALPEDHPKKMVMGQWGHATPRLADWTDVRHAWFDYWLMGYDGSAETGLPDTGVMDLPAVDSQVSTGDRHQSDTWPPAGTTTRTSGADVVGADSWRSERGSITVRSDVFETPTRIAGAVLLELELTTDTIDEHVLTADTQLVVRMRERRANGSTVTIETGMLNSRNRFGERSGVDLTDGETWTGTVEIGVTDHVVDEGSQLDFTIFSSSAGTGGLGPDITPDDDLPVTNTLRSAAVTYDVAPATSTTVALPGTGITPSAADALDPTWVDRLREGVSTAPGR